jgi:hypothetical protein
MAEFLCYCKGSGNGKKGKTEERKNGGMGEREK